MRAVGKEEMSSAPRIGVCYISWNAPSSKDVINDRSQTSIRRTIEPFEFTSRHQGTQTFFRSVHHEKQGRSLKSR
jgi:hypothetical protein